MIFSRTASFPTMALLISWTIWRVRVATSRTVRDSMGEFMLYLQAVFDKFDDAA